MTQAQHEQREAALVRSRYHCAVCGKPINEGQAQYAHRIANTKQNRAKYGSYFIDHTLNGEYTDCLHCNGLVDITRNKGKVLELLKNIIDCEIKRYKGEI